MVYVTAPLQVKEQDLFQKQISLLYGLDMPQHIECATKLTRTRTYEHEKDSLVDRMNLKAYFEAVSLLTIRCEHFLAHYKTATEMYTQFKIPKKSGGLRTINAPQEELKVIQRDIVYTLSHLPYTHSPFIHMHDAAFAYIAGRSTLDALKEHQANGSHWFLKLDIKDFFPSCKERIVMDLITQVYPICFIPEAELRLILRCCTLEGSLPQGAVTSPFLTNLLMVALDKKISDATYNWNKRRVVYTRYADDLLFSCREEFKWMSMQTVIEDILKPYGFEIKKAKTRYGSRAGSNWNLGLMLNKDNDISLGHQHKQRMRAMLFNFLKDSKSCIRWSIEDVQHLNGLLSYWRHIEPEYANSLLHKYEEKIGITFDIAMKNTVI